MNMRIKTIGIYKKSILKRRRSYKLLYVWQSFIQIGPPNKEEMGQRQSYVHYNRYSKILYDISFVVCIFLMWFYINKFYHLLHHMQLWDEVLFVVGSAEGEWGLVAWVRGDRSELYTEQKDSCNDTSNLPASDLKTYRPALRETSNFLASLENISSYWNSSGVIGDLCTPFFCSVFPGIRKSSQWDLSQAPDQVM